MFEYPPEAPAIPGNFKSPPLPFVASCAFVLELANPLLGWAGFTEDETPAPEPRWPFLPSWMSP